MDCTTIGPQGQEEVSLAPPAAGGRRRRCAEELAAAARCGAARRENGLAIAAQRHGLDSLRLQRGLLLAIRERGSATTDDLAEDLSALHRDGAWRGAAVRKLATAGVIRAAGMARCQRAARRGSPIMLWTATSPEALEGALRDLEQAIGAAEREAAGEPRRTQTTLSLEGAA